MIFNMPKSKKFAYLCLLNFKKSYPIPYDFVRAISFLCLLFLVAFLGYYFSSGETAFHAIMVKIGTFMLFSLISIFLFKREFLFLKRMINNGFSKI